MELADSDLYDLADKNPYGFDEDDFRPLMEQVVEGLEFLHDNNVLHRDIKPENVLIFGNVAKLTDYSLVREVHEGTISRTLALGTPHYVAPEMVSLDMERDNFKLDIFSLGITFYECLTGDVVDWEPWEFNSVSPNYLVEKWQELNGQVASCDKSPEVVDLMVKMIDIIVPNRPNIKQVKTHPWFRMN